MKNAAPKHFDEDSQIRIQMIEDLAGTRAAMSVFQTAWGPSAANDLDTYLAVATHGGYLALGWRDDQPVVASFGFRSIDPLTGGMALHSHMTAVKQGFESAGLGLAIKTHQRHWARDQGMQAITWTFDPLQRRNAHFNLVRLGATVMGFHRNLYGALDDTINAGSETDRLEVRLDVSTTGGTIVVPTPDDVVFALPESIDKLRRADATRAAQIQHQLSAMLDGLAAGTLCVRGMSADHAYVLSRKL